MKKHSIKLTALALALVLTAALALTGCGSKDGDSAATIQIAVPNDTTNEARALLLLEKNGIIKLADGAGITATKNDIVENPYGVEIVETEAAQIPNILQDVDYAVINSNYAINAGLNPVADSLVIEGSSSAYANILAVKEGNESSDKIKALVAALESQQVVDYINEKYDGAVVSTVDDPTDGYDASVDYDALAGATIPRPRTLRSSRLPRRSLPRRTSPSISRPTTTTSCPTPSSKTAPWTPTTSSTPRTLMISMPRTAPTSFLLPPFTLSPWASTAASRPRSMR